MKMPFWTALRLRRSRLTRPDRALSWFTLWLTSKLLVPASWPKSKVDRIALNAVGIMAGGPWT
jgi:hypothetical protein